EPSSGSSEDLKGTLLFRLKGDIAIHGRSWGHPHFQGVRGLVALSVTESGGPLHSGKKWMDLSEEIAWVGNIMNFGDILTERVRSSRSCPVRSFPIRMSVDGSSQRRGRTVASGQWSVASECKAGTSRGKKKMTERSQFAGDVC